jgi:hypothetical protein
MVKSYVYNCTTYPNIGDCNDGEGMGGRGRGVGEGGGEIQ